MAVTRVIVIRGHRRRLAIGMTDIAERYLFGVSDNLEFVTFIWIKKKQDIMGKDKQYNFIYK